MKTYKVEIITNGVESQETIHASSFKEVWKVLTSWGIPEKEVSRIQQIKD